MRTLGRTRALFLSCLSLWACGDGGSKGADAGAPDADTGDELGDDASVPAQVPQNVVDFELDEGASATTTISFAKGGSISATGADGTQFQLDVPPYAVASDVAITLTPLQDVLGVSEAGPVYGAVLAPDGLVLQALAQLRITPVDAIDARSWLAFQATGNGADPGAALVDPAATANVLLIDHFSVVGVASVSDEERATFLAIESDDKSTLFSHRVGAALNDAHRAQLLGEAASAADLDDAFAEFETDVLTPLYHDANGSCDGSNGFLDSALRDASMRTLVGAMPSAEVTSQLLDVVLAKQTACDAEALSLCRNSRDPAYLLEFRLREARAHALLVAAGVIDDNGAPADLADLADESASACTVSGYVASGGSTGLTVSGELDDPSYPFTLQGDLDGLAIVVIRYTPAQGNANTGTYAYSAKSGESGQGSYTLSTAQGGGMTLVQDGQRCTSDGCVSSEDTIVFSPRS